MIDFLRDDLSRNWMKFGYSKTWQEELFSKINPAALMIGFARRFAPYKRADMILSDLDRLDRILNHPTRPVHIVFAGKAHPNDEMGKDLIRKVIGVCKDERFRGKIFFVEGYDIRIARHLVQGVDVWLNTPRRPLEASGTSGEKVVANGVLNLSISDGWWVEGYDGTNGWTIGPVVKGYAEETENADEEDSQSLYTLLENSVIPLFYDREMSGLPEKWIAMIKRSMQTLVPRFNTERMLVDYYRDLYLPDGAAGARTLRRILPDGQRARRLEAEDPHALLLAAPPGRQRRGDPRRHDPRGAAVDRHGPDRSRKDGTGGGARGTGHRKEGRQRLRRTAGVRPAEDHRPGGGRDPHLLRLLHGPAERRLRLRHPRAAVPSAPRHEAGDGAGILGVGKSLGNA